MRSCLLICTLAVSLAFVARPASAQFTFVKQSDPMTDADRSVIWTAAVDGKTRMAWGCMEDGLNAMIYFDRYLAGRGDLIGVQYRFPPGPPTGEAMWNLSTNNRGAFIPVRSAPIFTKFALAQRRLVVRVRDTDGDTVTGEFSLEGLGEALKQLPCYRPQ